MKMVENKDSAELMILELMRRYSFSLSLLQDLLRRKANQPQVAWLICIQLTIATENDLNVSFSKLRYVDIAPSVGLDPYLDGTDIPTFEMFRARLTTNIFMKIVEDLQIYAWQYGGLLSHINEEARARYLSGVKHSLFPLKSPLLRRKPIANGDAQLVFQSNCSSLCWCFVQHTRNTFGR